MAERNDIVYILGNESKWQDKEIMYSIRSVAEHCDNYRKIFVVGKKPAFLNERVIEIPYIDLYVNKARNIMAKIRRAAIDRRLTNNFMLLNDDYFFLKPVDVTNYPYYYKCDLDESIKINSHNLNYRGHLEATRKILLNAGRTTKNFDVHYPIIYNKFEFCNVCLQYDWAVPEGYIMKSIYCNTLGIVGEQRKDCKVNHPHLKENWPNVNNGLESFSIGDRSINSGLEKYLSELFPEKCSYEI